MSDKLKFFEFYLGLNNYKNQDNYIKIAKSMIEKDLESIYNKSYNGKIFDYFAKYIKWDLSQEDFVSIGDTYGIDDNLQNNNGGIQACFELWDQYQTDKSFLDNKLILIDECSYGFFTGKLSEEYEEMRNYILENGWDLFVL